MKLILSFLPMIGLILAVMGTNQCSKSDKRGLAKFFWIFLVWIVPFIGPLIALIFLRISPNSDTSVTPVVDEPMPPNTNVRPWVRFWARSFDYLWFSAVLVSSLHILLPRVSINDYLWVVIVSFLWCLVEPLFLTRYGASPGKGLLGIKVTNARGPILPYRLGFIRSLDVWFHACAIGIPLVYIYSYFVSYKALKKNGVTLWDKKNGTLVIHSAVKSSRVLIMVLLWVAILWIALFSQIQL